jgi:hypothetical protein
MHTAPVSLLERHRRPNEQAAWERFVHLHTRLRRHCAQRLGLHRADADDLVQDMFVVLVQKLLTCLGHSPGVLPAEPQPLPRVPGYEILDLPGYRPLLCSINEFVNP